MTGRRTTDISATALDALRQFAAGVNLEIVADRLGHHRVAFMLDTYTHVMPGQHAEAAEAAARLLVQDASSSSQRFQSG